MRFQLDIPVELGLELLLRRNQFFLHFVQSVDSILLASLFQLGELVLHFKCLKKSIKLVSAIFLPIEHLLYFASILDRSVVHLSLHLQMSSICQTVLHWKVPWLG